MKIEDVISSLYALNLSTFPNNEVNQLIASIGRFGCIIVDFHPGKIITRGRPNEEGEVFLSRDALSFKPAHLNNSYQRASTPNMTMFYGVVIPEKSKEDEIKDPRVVIAFESMSWFRDKTKKGVKRITISDWIVEKKISLMAIVQHKDFLTKHGYIKELSIAFEDFIHQHPEEVEKTLAITAFFAKEFAKDVEYKNNHEYILSAIFTEWAVKLGLDGVLYPSMRVDGQGFNIAITPDAANSLKLVNVGECLVYKNLERSFIDNEKLVMNIEDQTNFKLNDVASHEHAGEKIALKEIGINSIEDLY